MTFYEQQIEEMTQHLGLKYFKGINYMIDNPQTPIHLNWFWFIKLYLYNETVFVSAYEYKNSQKIAIGIEGKLYPVLEVSGIASPTTHILRSINLIDYDSWLDIQSVSISLCTPLLDVRNLYIAFNQRTGNSTFDQLRESIHKMVVELSEIYGDSKLKKIIANEYDGSLNDQ
jgi:hypothetical protein